MLSVLNNPTYRHLFFAQVIALVGTGLATVALGLLAYDLAGPDAGAVLGTALAIKMVAYISVAPVAGAFAEYLPRKAMLVSLDLVRAGIAVMLPFVSEIWQVYLLIFVLQAASAAFTPTFQATIPDILPDEREYTRALSLSRLAYDLESVISPMLAAALLTVVSFHSLFGGTVIGFLVSAAMVTTAVLPRVTPGPKRSVYERTTKGVRIFMRTPRLRGLLALNLAVAAASAMVIVNTVVLVQARFGLDQRSMALALMAFGAGSMGMALALPRLLERLDERRIMLAGGAILVIGLALGVWLPSYETLIALWVVLGAGYSLAQTPSGRILRRSSNAQDRPALFAAQFALSHACWLITYPVAGWLGTTFSITAAFGGLAVIAGAAWVLSKSIWDPRFEIEVVAHRHDDLPADHPHVQGGKQHAHPFVINDEHRKWPDH